MKRVQHPSGAGVRAVGWFVRRAGIARMTTLALAVGIALAALTGPRLVLATAGLAAVLGTLVLGLAWRASEAPIVTPSLLVVSAVVLTGLLSGYLVGGVRVAELGRSPLSRHSDAQIQAQVTLLGTPKQSGGWQRVVARVDKAALLAGQAEGRAEALPSATGEHVLVEIESPGAAAAVHKQGEILALRGRVQRPATKSASGFDQATYLRNQGIAVVLAVQAGSVERLGNRGGVSGWFDHLRDKARSHLSRGPDKRLDRVLQGVVMGETDGLDQGWVEAFRRSGTAHMFSVSGLHVASLAALMMGLAKLARAPRWLGFLSAAVASGLMIPFVGASPPVVRAVVMISVVLFGQWVGRRRDQWQVLGLAASAVLCLNPYSLFDIGFQLSFAAFAGLISLLKPLQRALSFLPRGIASNAAVSIAASVGTAPVSLAVFGRTSLVAVFANLLVVPTLAPVIGLGLGSVAAGFLWPGLSVALDYAVSPLLAWTVEVSRLFALAPVLQTQQLQHGGVAALFAVMAFPAALALVGRILRLPSKVRLPFYRTVTLALYRRRPRSRRLAVSMAALLVLAASVAGWVAYSSVQSGIGRVIAVTRDWPRSLEVRVLDVGQGNAVLVRTPDHHALLFDAGPSGCNLEKQLQSLGVTRLDAVLVSHPHADHFAGLLDCVESVHVDTIIDHVEVVATRRGAGGSEASGSPGAADGAEGPRGPDAAGGHAATGDSGAAAAPSSAASGGAEARAYLRLRQELEDHGSAHVLAHEDMMLAMGGLTIHLFTPQDPLVLVDGPDPWARVSKPPGGDEMNATSIVALVSWGEKDFLLPGDAEADVLERYPLPAVEVLVVPHHGSKGAVSSRLLERLAPRVAAVSVGAENMFGHPDPATMALLRTSLGTVLRTDQSGWVSFVVTDTTMRVTAERRAGS